MKTINQFPYLAIAFGILAIATAVILVLDSPPWLHWIFALIWAITGLLGLYQGMKR